MKGNELVYVDTEKQGYHEDVIVCPECGEMQNAKVLHINGIDVKSHQCVTCGFQITGSDWYSTIVI